MIGRVVSIKLLKTVTVLVERVARHPLYKKTYVQSKKYLVNDSIGVEIGDIVDFVSCKPISKNKHWKITKVLGKNVAKIAEADLKKKAEEVISQVMPEEKAEKELSVVSPQIEKAIDEKEKKPRKKKGRTELSK